MKFYTGILAAFTIFMVSCSTDTQIEEIQEIENLESDVTQKRRLPNNRTDGTNKGFFWTVYQDVGNRGGRTDINFPQANQYSGNFDIQWRNVKNVVGGKGWRNGSNRTVGYNVGRLEGNPEFVGLYGWTKNPDVEYYVVEKGRAGVDGSYTYVKTYRTNGGTYDFYKKFIRNRPCALRSGNCNFWQYKSVRRNQIRTGRNYSINVNNHRNRWKGEGFGNYTQYQVFGAEAYDGSSRATGRINATVW